MLAALETSYVLVLNNGCVVSNMFKAYASGVNKIIARDINRNIVIDVNKIEDWMPNQFEFIIVEDNKLILVKLFSIFKNFAELSYF